jgi:protein-L-isoaspartate(D-aspartate) O-methyltransferase
MGHQDILKFAQSLDRSFFIDNEYKSCANLNEPLPIGYGQTISQPSLVLEMSQLLCPDSDKSVLEIGTGSGYQTAILAHFSKCVYTFECIAELANTARRKLDSLGYTNISYRIGDGSVGWSEHAPYDRIIVTAAARRIPEELLDQLSEGGIMVIPVGPRDLQELILVTKDTHGNIRTQSMEYVRFVEMIGKYGWSNTLPPFSDK